MLLAQISPEATDAATRLLSDSQWGAILLTSWGAFFTAIGGLFTYVVMLSRQQRNDLMTLNNKIREEADDQMNRIIEINNSAREMSDEALKTLNDTNEVVRNLQRSVDSVAAESRACSEAVRALNIRLDSRPCLVPGGGRR